jgi:hypothetical protein
VDFLIRGACAGRDVLGAELLLEAALESGNLLGGVLGYPLLGLDEGVGDAGVLVPGAVSHCQLPLRSVDWHIDGRRDIEQGDDIRGHLGNVFLVAFSHRLMAGNLKMAKIYPAVEALKAGVNFEWICLCCLTGARCE